MFSSQVDFAIDQEFSYIYCHAAGTYHSASLYNGWYTWILFGYNATLSELKRVEGPDWIEKVERTFPDCKDLRDIFDSFAENLTTDEKDEIISAAQEKDKKRGRPPRTLDRIKGSDWWYRYGKSISNAVFDLREGSKSRNYFDAFRKRYQR